MGSRTPRVPVSPAWLLPNDERLAAVRVESGLYAVTGRDAEQVKQVIPTAHGLAILLIRAPRMLSQIDAIAEHLDPDAMALMDAAENSERDILDRMGGLLDEDQP
jgi:hypothetical protein